MNLYSKELKDGILTFLFNGEMNTLNCMAIEEELIAEVNDHSGMVIFDMEKVDYVASSFIRLCGSVSKLVGSNNLKLKSMNRSVKKVLKKVGLYSMLKY